MLLKYSTNMRITHRHGQRTRSDYRTDSSCLRTHTELGDDDIDHAADHDQSIKRVPGIDEIMLQERSCQIQPEENFKIRREQLT